MDHSALSETLETLIEPYLDAQGIELVELAVSGNVRRRILRIYVDRPGGITIGACAEVSRQLADLLDTHDPIEGSYTLEVSSPGLTRELKRRRDFERAVGKSVKLVLDGGHVVTGQIEDVAGEMLVLKASEAEDTPAESYSLADIAKANLNFET